METYSYIIRGLNHDGSETRYYTGRAGKLWLSPERSEAFKYSEKFHAQTKAKNFNRMEPIHGFYFVATVE
jgi:hypothetical protein